MRPIGPLPSTHCIRQGVSKKQCGEFSTGAVTEGPHHDADCFKTTFAFPQQNLGVSHQNSMSKIPQTYFWGYVTTSRRGLLLDRPPFSTAFAASFPTGQINSAPEFPWIVSTTIVAPKNGLFLGPPWISAVSPPLCELLSHPHPLIKVTGL